MGLQFQLPDSNDVLTASGETITRDGQTVGVRFTNLPARRGLGHRVVPELRVSQPRGWSAPAAKPAVPLSRRDP